MCSQLQTPLAGCVLHLGSGWASGTLGGQKDRSARRTVALRSDAELSIPVPLPRNSGTFGYRRPCDQVLCGRSLSE